MCKVIQLPDPPTWFRVGGRFYFVECRQLHITFGNDVTWIANFGIYPFACRVLRF